MTYYCNLCYKTINLKSKHKHFKSKIHKFLEDFIILRYIAENPDINQLNEIMKKYVNIYNKKYYFYQIRCVLKVLVNVVLDI